MATWRHSKRTVSGVLMCYQMAWHDSTSQQVSAHICLLNHEPAHLNTHECSSTCQSEMCYHTNSHIITGDLTLSSLFLCKAATNDFQLFFIISCALFYCNQWIVLAIKSQKMVKNACWNFQPPNIFSVLFYPTNSLTPEMIMFSIIHNKEMHQILRSEINKYWQFCLKKTKIIIWLSKYWFIFCQLINRLIVATVRSFVIVNKSQKESTKANSGSVRLSHPVCGTQTSLFITTEMSKICNFIF